MTLRTTLFLGIIYCFLSCKRDKVPTDNCTILPGNSEVVTFIGEKICLNDIGFEGMDSKFSARYKILELLCGNYTKDTIDFIVYDHYGIPGFSRYNTVLLFLNKHEDTFYHSKYQFFDLYKTTNGQWASPSTWFSDSTMAKPHKIDFATEVSYDIRNLKRQRIREIFPAPYYKIQNGKAIAEYGNYLGEILEMRKKQAIRAQKSASDDIEVVDTELAEIIYPETFNKSNVGYHEFIQNWKVFIAAIETKNTQKLKEMSVNDSIPCSVCEGFSEDFFYNDREPIDSFIATSYRNFPSSQAWKSITSNKFITEINKYTDSTDPYSGTEEKNKLIRYDIIFRDSLRTKEFLNYITHTFSFIKKDGKYKFYGMKTW